jgi:large subunit ribosomal protein L30e|tara:strand:+ start:109 stop:450 length:342 start_codon:yes stop_codon:yes gene_type:complete
MELYLQGTMAQKLLEKTLKDAIKEDQCILGTKQVLNSISKSKLVVLSKSIQTEMRQKIESDAKKSKIQTLTFNGTSVNLGKLCGLQFRVSTLSLPQISESDIVSLKKEFESQL